MTICPNCKEYEWEIVETLHVTYYHCRWCKKMYRPHELEDI